MFRQDGKTVILTAIIILLLAILLAVTNPDRESHINRITDKLSEKDAITNVLNLGLLTINPPEYKSYALFSTTTYKNKTASIGIFSYVWVNKNVFK